MLFQQILPAFIREPLITCTEPASIWVVGGAVRDHFLGFKTRDLDFAVRGDARRTARAIADALGAAYFELDPDRDVGRVLLQGAHSQKWTLDFTALRGKNIEADLIARDFTLNAMAVSPMTDVELVDVTGGLQDLYQGVLRLCHPEALNADPVRTLRLARFAAKLEFKIDPASRQRVPQAAGRLLTVSWERIRDELFQILDLPNITTGLKLLERFQLLSAVLPELDALKGLEQSPPHAFDVWDHTLAVVTHLEDLLRMIEAEDVNSVATNLNLAEIALALQPYRECIRRRVLSDGIGDRSIAQLLIFSALYHDAGKAETVTREAEGRIRFLGHEAASAAMASRRGMQLRLSNEEIKTVSTVVRNHMRPGQLAKQDPLSRRSIIRFLKASGQTAVETLLLSIADFLGKGVPPANQNQLSARLEICKSLLDGYQGWFGELESLESLIKGDELMEELELTAGPVVGELLAYIQEAQLAGDIQTRDEALQLAKQAIDRA